MFLFKSYAENEAWKLVPDLLFILKKSFVWGKGKLFAAYFQ